MSTTAASRKMTEAQAWREAAKFFAGARHSGRRPAQLDSYYQLWGVCSVLRHFEKAGRIDSGLMGQMMTALPEATVKPAASHTGSKFCWPMSAKGHQQRVAFCRRMARLASPKPKKRPSGRRRRSGSRTPAAR